MRGADSVCAPRGCGAHRLCVEDDHGTHEALVAHVPGVLRAAVTDFPTGGASGSRAPS